MNTASGLVTPQAADVPWSRLSRRMLVVHPVVELVRASPVLVAAVFAGAHNGRSLLNTLVVVVLVAALGLFRWFTTTYRVTPSQVQLRRGLLRRREVAVPRDRVRTVDVEATPMHRIVGLTRLVIGTGRTDRKDTDHSLRLDGLTVAQADGLRNSLLHHRDLLDDRSPTAVDLSTPPVETADHRPARRPALELLRFDPAWIRYGPFTLTGLVTVVVVAGVVWRGVNEAQVNIARSSAATDTRRYLEGTSPWLIAVQVVIGLAVLAAILSTLGYVLAFWRMRVTRTGEGTLHVTRGLLTTRAITLEERRIRGVEISEPLLLRAVGGARLIALATGLRVGRGAERGGSLLVPPSPRTESIRVAGDVIGSTLPVTEPVVAHPPAATRRRAVRALLPATVVAVALVVAAILAGSAVAGVVVAVLLVLAAGLLARDRAGSLGHRLDGEHVVTREGSVVRRRAVLDREAVVGVVLSQSWFQRRSGLTTATLTTAAGRQGYRILDAGASDAESLALALIPQAQDFGTTDP